MASCTTYQWATQAPQMRLTVSYDSSTSTGDTAYLKWTLQYLGYSPPSTSGGRAYDVYINNVLVRSSTYDINAKTGTITVASGTYEIAKTSADQSIPFKVSIAWNITWNTTYKGTQIAQGTETVPAMVSCTVTYNANGGSGAPSAQTKWFDSDLTLSTTKPTRTGYTFLGWSTSSTATTATYAPGDTYSTNSSITLYAVWKANTYTVSYNANGGSGAPSAQTKTYGVNLTLSSTKPTRTNYNFLGWGTSASATSVAYAPGASYTANSAITLYAVWELAYTNPRITGVDIRRIHDDWADGKYIYVGFSWATDYDVSSILVEWKKTSANTWSSAIVSDETWSTDTVVSSGTSGLVSGTTLGIDGSFTEPEGISEEYSYDVRVTVSDAYGSTTVSRVVPGKAYPIDFLAGGKGVAIGKAAETSNLFEVELPAQFNNSLTVNGNFVRPKRCIVGQSGSTSTNPWYRFASLNFSTAVEDMRISFDVTYGFSNSLEFGTLDVSIRTDSSGLPNLDATHVRWRGNDRFDPSRFVLACDPSGGTYELWIRINAGYTYALFEVASESYRNAFANKWVLHNISSAGYASEVTSGYTQVTAISYDAFGLYPSGQDPNTCLSPVIVTSVNTPNSALFYVHTMIYNNNTYNNRVQIAYRYNEQSATYIRRCVSDVWTEWEVIGNRIRLGDTEYMFRTGTTGAAGYITFVL